jgi:DNA-directed RNA polymerase subunit RPC12/RpoP
MIEYACTRCRRRLESPSEHAGILVDCPYCNAQIRVPSAHVAAIVEPLDEPVVAKPPSAPAVRETPGDPFANLDVEEPAPRSKPKSAPKHESRRSRRDDDYEDDDRERDRKAEPQHRSRRQPAVETKKASNAVLLLLGIGIGVLLIGGGIGIWFAVKDPKPKGDDKKEAVEAPQVPQAPLDSAGIFKTAVASVALIEVLNEKDNKYVGGSGSIIDKQRKLVLTAYHVVEDAETIDVIFPKHDKNGELVTVVGDYGRADRIAAKIWRKDPSKDLAILQVDWVPPESRAIPLAAASPKPGEETHTVGGSPLESIGLWIYSGGKVREVQHDTFVLDNKQKIDSWIIRATNPINPGDSGGGLFNKSCELVGVCCASNRRADSIRAFIDVREVKNLLGRK